MIHPKESEISTTSHEPFFHLREIMMLDSEAKHVNRLYHRSADHSADHQEGSVWGQSTTLCIPITMKSSDPYGCFVFCPFFSLISDLLEPKLYRDVFSCLGPPPFNRFPDPSNSRHGFNGASSPPSAATTEHVPATGGVVGQQLRPRQHR